MRGNSLRKPFRLAHERLDFVGPEDPAQVSVLFPNHARIRAVDEVSQTRIEFIAMPRVDLYVDLSCCPHPRFPRAQPTMGYGTEFAFPNTKPLSNEVHGLTEHATVGVVDQIGSFSHDVPNTTTAAET